MVGRIWDRFIRCRSAENDSPDEQSLAERIRDEGRRAQWRRWHAFRHRRGKTSIQANWPSRGVIIKTLCRADQRRDKSHHRDERRDSETNPPRGACVCGIHHSATHFPLPARLAPHYWPSEWASQCAPEANTTRRTEQGDATSRTQPRCPLDLSSSPTARPLPTPITHASRQLQLATNTGATRLCRRRGANEWIGPFDTDRIGAHPASNARGM